MTRAVRVDIQNDIIKPAAMQNKVLEVVFRVRLNLAKNTARLSVGTCGGGYVFTAPWAPQPIQLSYLGIDYRIGG